MKKISDFKIVKTFLSLQKKQKIVFVVLAAVFVLCIIMACVFSCSAGSSSVNLVFENNSEYFSKISYAKSAEKSGSSYDRNVTYFKFSDDQKNEIRKFYGKNKSFSLILKILLEGAGSHFSEKLSVPHNFSLGFLYSWDFDSTGNVKKTADRVTASADLNEFLKEQDSCFEAGLAVAKDLKSSELPWGFVVYSELDTEILQALVSISKIGFDFSDQIPYFGEPSNGGKFLYASREFDFSGASFVFPVQTSVDAVMPEVEFSFTALENYGTSENPVKVKLSAGGERLSFYRTASVQDYVIQTATMQKPFSFYNFFENKEQVQKCLMISNSQTLADINNHLPLKTDLGMILGSDIKNWRNSEYELYEWDRFKGVLFFDTKDYDVQAKFFTRLAFFAEKKGFIGSILTDVQIGNLHGYNAHDYSAETLAKFFTKAEPLNVLNSKEMILKEILIKNGVIVQTPEGYSAGTGAVISISRESPDYNRRSFVAHEAWHGIFFLDEGFRNATSAVYYTIDPKSLEFLIQYWQSQPGLSYDPADLYLMNNEFMAYIMQQPLNQVAGYFLHLAGRGSVMKALPELCDYVKQSKGLTFEDAAKIFESYAFDNFGLACGRVNLIAR